MAARGGLRCAPSRAGSGWRLASTKVRRAVTARINLPPSPRPFRAEPHSAITSGRARRCRPRSVIGGHHRAVVASSLKAQVPMRPARLVLCSFTFLIVACVEPSGPNSHTPNLPACRLDVVLISEELPCRCGSQDVLPDEVADNSYCTADGSDVLLRQCLYTATADCGDPVVAAAFSSCSAATDESTCTSAGGRWTPAPDPNPFFTRYCACPTGQGDCCCLTDRYCLGTCEYCSGSSDCRGFLVGKCDPYTCFPGKWHCYP